MQPSRHLARRPADDRPPRRRRYPEECCGFLIGRVRWRTRPSSSASSRWTTSGRTAGTTGILIHPETVLAAHKEARAAGARRRGLLPFPSGPSGAAERVRPRARVAGAFLPDRLRGRAARWPRPGAGASLTTANGSRKRVSPQGINKEDVMSVTIHIPTPLRRFTGEQGEVQVEGATVGEAMQDLVRRHPSLQRHLYHRRRGSAQLRQPLPERRGRAPPREGRHPGVERGHALDHPLDRRRCERAREGADPRGHRRAA